jgi:hypothetical protein
VGRREPSAGRCAGLDCVRLPALILMLRTPVGGNFLACIQRTSVDLPIATRFGHIPDFTSIPRERNIVAWARSARIID